MLRSALLGIMAPKRRKGSRQDSFMAGEDEGAPFQSVVCAPTRGDLDARSSECMEQAKVELPGVPTATESTKDSCLALPRALTGSIYSFVSEDEESVEPASYHSSADERQGSRGNRGRNGVFRPSRAVRSVYKSAPLPGDRVAAASGRLLVSEVRQVVGDAGMCLVLPMGNQSEDMEVGEDVRALVVAGHCVSVAGSCSIIQQVLEQRGSHPVPIIAVVLDVPAALEDARPVVEMVSELRQAGADDVIWNARSNVELRAALELSMRFRSAPAGQCRPEQDAEPPMGLFWQSAHLALRGLPKLEEELPEEMVEGAEVGPCVLGASLGSGGFGEVREAYNVQTQAVEAVKTVKKRSLGSMEAVTNLWREINSMKRLDHPGVVRLHGVMQGPNHVMLRMERVGTKNLFAVVKRHRVLPTAVCKDYMAQLADALAHCHAREVAHRDIKPENVVVSDCGRYLKLVDFGMAVRSTEKRTSLSGTFPFMAPEVLEKMTEAPCNGYMPCPVDVWALGVVMIEMLAGIGRMSALMNWKRGARPCAEHAIDLEAVFGTDGGVRKLWSARGFPDMAPDGFWLLEGMLTMKPHLRSTAPVVQGSSWVRPRGSGSASASEGASSANGEGRPTAAEAATEEVSVQHRPLRRRT